MRSPSALAVRSDTDSKLYRKIRRRARVHSLNGKRAHAGIVLSGIGGKFRVETEDGNILICTARGVLRRGGGKLLPGDRVTVETCTDIKLSDGTHTEDNTVKKSGASFPGTAGTARDGSDGVISELIPRKNELIRPPLANLERIFAVISSAFPEPSTLLADKLITIAEHEGIEPIIVISKRDLSPENAERLTDIYIRCGFTSFSLSSATGEGVDTLRDYIAHYCADGISTFAGVSGAGKSTLLNALFPSLELKTGELSEKLARGKNTTRTSELFSLDSLLGTQAAASSVGSHGYIADTPGFSMIDFTRYDYYELADLPHVFREFEPYLANCRYSRCTHTCEDGCAVLEAVKTGAIPKTRHESYLSIYADLKDKRRWKK